MVKLKSSKCLKASDDGIDRISSLPNPLLSHILSLLPTKCAVATSVLSIRWKFVWTSITNLDLHCDDEDSSLSNKALRLRRKKFTHFVNRVLLLLNPPSLQKFRLSCNEDYCDTSYINSWILTAFGRTIRELDIILTLGDPFELPLRDICCNVSFLKLDGDIHFNIPAAASLCFPSLQTLYLYSIMFEIASNSSVSFPNLKELTLYCVKSCNEDSVHRLFSICPILEELFVVRESVDDVYCLIIRIPSLKRLSFHFLDYGNYHPHKLQIDTPALQFLDLDNELMNLDAENLSSLVQANVSVDFVDEDKLDEDTCFSISKFIRSLSNVKCLSILDQAMTAFRVASTNISPSFHNLTKLDLEMYNCIDLAVIINNYLENMDNLEHLVLKGSYSQNNTCSHQSWWTEPLKVPKCLLLRVTTVSFHGMIDGCCDQLELLRYFLKNAEVLQLLKIGTNHISENKQNELLKKISLIPRGSRTCQVAFT